MNPKALSRPALMFLLVAAALIGGCIDSQPLPPGRLDEAWQPSASLWDQATTRPADDPDAKGPYRYEIVYEPSVAWSVIELNRTVQQWGELETTARFHVSQQHANAVATRLHLLAEQTSRMAGALNGGDSPANLRRWAEASADLINQVHQLIAAIDPDPRRRKDLTIDETAAWVLMPIMEALGGTLSGQGKLSQAEQSEQLLRTERAILRVLLTTSFRLAGRRLPEEALQDVFEVQNSQRPQEARQNTAKLILWHHRKSEPVASESNLDTAQAARTADHLSDGMRYLAALSKQWPKVQMLALEIRRYHGRRIVAFEFDIKEGQQVEMRDLDFLAPAIVFSGHGRIIIQGQPNQPDGRAWSILFQSDNGGSMTLDFDKPVFFLVRLLAFPIQTARMKEIRFASLADDRGRSRQIEVLLEPVELEQSRQLIRVSKREEPLLQDRANMPPRLVGRQEDFSLEFFNAERRWHYQRQKTSKPELWK